jgi:hypothetical protein
MSLVFATQLTAIATAVLAVFEILTTMYAVRAFRKQSQETRDQAEMLRRSLSGSTCTARWSMSNARSTPRG